MSIHVDLYSTYWIFIDFNPSLNYINQYVDNR